MDDCTTRGTSPSNISIFELVIKVDNRCHERRNDQEDGDFKKWMEDFVQREKSTTKSEGTPLAASTPSAALNMNMRMSSRVSSRHAHATANNANAHPHALSQDNRAISISARDL